MSTSHLVEPPKCAPEIAKLGKVHASQSLPFALYNLAGVLTEGINRLVATLDKDNSTKPAAIYLVSLAPESKVQQKTLQDTLIAHI